MAIPRIRDFSVDSAPVPSTVVVTTVWACASRSFSEIDYDKIDAIRGLDITITTTARTDEEGRALLARSISRFGTEDESVAKQSMINREAKRARTVEQYAARRAALKGNDSRSSQQRRATAGSAKAAADPATRCESDTVAQPLPADRPVAWLLSQVRSGSQQAAGSHDAW